MSGSDLKPIKEDFRKADVFITNMVSAQALSVLDAEYLQHSVNAHFSRNCPPAKKGWWQL